MPTPIINLIAANVVSTINGITLRNGYQCNLIAARLSSVPRDPQTGLAQIRKEKPEQIPDNVPTGWVEWRQPFVILVSFLPNATESDGLQNPEDRLAVFTADITKAMRVDINRGGYAIDTSVAEPADDLPPEGNYHVAAIVTVRYRTLWDDPYSGNG